MKMRRVSIFMVWAMLGVAPVSKAAAGESVEFLKDSLTNQMIYFKIGSTAIDSLYQDNTQALAQINSMLSDTAIISRLDSIRITATSSPDGSYANNKQLAIRRAETLKTYIKQHYPQIPLDVIHTHGEVESWLLMRPMLTQGTPYRTEIAEILDLKLPASSTEVRLKSVDNGKMWRYITHQYLPLMRSGVTCVIYTSKAIIMPDTTSSVDNTMPPTEPTEPEVVIFPVVGRIMEMERQTECRPLFALKTNMLYDALTALNIEIEVIIGERWSIAGEYIFPWWLSNRKQYCLQSLSGYIEGRYWLGERAQRRQLTGWFVGLYTGGGHYDVQWNNKGYQGEFYIPVGVSGGYAHQIGRNLSLEYSLGIGYMRTRYNSYTPQICRQGEVRLVRQSNDICNWVGPTKVKVSLVWLINYKRK